MVFTTFHLFQIMAGKAKGLVGIFGTPQELRDFGEVFFGSLAIALVYFLVSSFYFRNRKTRHKKVRVNNASSRFLVFYWNGNRWLGSYARRGR